MVRVALLVARVAGVCYFLRADAILVALAGSKLQLPKKNPNEAGLGSLEDLQDKEGK